MCYQFKFPLKKLKLDNLILDLGQIFCIIPWHIENQTRKPKLNKIIILVYSLMVPTFGIYRFCRTLNQIYCVNRFDYLLVLFDRSISLLFSLLVLVIMNFGKKKTWFKFFQLLFETNNGIIKKTFATDLLITLSQLVFFVVKFATNYWRIKMNWLDFFYLCDEIIHEYHFLLTTLVICKYSDLIGVRYDGLMETLKSKKATDSDEAVMTVSNVGKKYRAIFKVTKCYNDIFGWAILLIFAHTIVQIVRSTIMLLGLLEGYIMSIGLVSVMCNVIMAFSETIYITLNWEATSAKCLKLEHLCLKLQEKIKIDSPARTELFRLTKIIQTFRPKFTATNFFTIHRGTILGIINLSGTYLLVLVQFYVTQNEEARRQMKWGGNDTWCLSFCIKN